MQEIAAYVTLAVVSIALILSIAVAAALSIAIYEISEWIGRMFTHGLPHPANSRNMSVSK